MKRFKKLILLMMCVGMIGSMTACGNRNNAENGADQGTPGTADDAGTNNNNGTTNNGNSNTNGATDGTTNRDNNNTMNDNNGDGVIDNAVHDVTDGIDDVADDVTGNDGVRDDNGNNNNR